MTDPQYTDDEVLDMAHRYLATIYADVASSNDPIQKILLHRFFPLFNQLILDGAQLRVPSETARRLTFSAIEEAPLE